MRSLRRELPGLLVVVPFAAPMICIRIFYGRRWHAMPLWAQQLTHFYLAIAALLLATLVVSAIISNRRWRQRSREYATTKAIEAMAPRKPDDGIA